jgi:hypothetical protein
MEDRKIIFKIAGDGQLTVEGEGFKGETCLEKSGKYLSGLGVTLSQEKKSEFYEEAAVELMELT